MTLYMSTGLISHNTIPYLNTFIPHTGANVAFLEYATIFENASFSALRYLSPDNQE